MAQTPAAASALDDGEDGAALKTAASMRGRRRRSSVSPVPDSAGKKVLPLFGLSQTQPQNISPPSLLVVGCQAGWIAGTQALLYSSLLLYWRIACTYREVAGS